ncbi:uncharacterized protein LOC101737817 isoform X2 [Bombyx mori]
MSMPDELSTSVQGVLRTMISGVMLVQCFTVYVYLATYIVLLYPVFLEERPALVLPWLLVAAIRKLLCELTSLALGLGTCVLLGAARSPCVKFVIVKFASITPSFYMWVITLSYYNALKVVAAFKTFPNVVPASHCDYGLELAIRRRRTKSLQGEEQLRRKLLTNFYGEQTVSSNDEIGFIQRNEHISRMVHSTDTSIADSNDKIINVIQGQLETTKRLSDAGSYEDWCINEIVIPRDTDRILEQFVLMSLRVSDYLKKEGTDSMNSQSLILKTSNFSYRQDALHCAAITTDIMDNSSYLGSIKGSTASYLKEYPKIFMKKPSHDQTPHNTQNLNSALVSSSNNSECKRSNLETFDSFDTMEQSFSPKQYSYENNISTQRIDRDLTIPQEKPKCCHKLCRMRSIDIPIETNEETIRNSDESIESVGNLKAIAKKFNDVRLTESQDTEVDDAKDVDKKDKTPSIVSLNNSK